MSERVVQRRLYDLFAVQSATERAQSYTEIAIKRAERMQTDPEKTKRRKAGECRWCFYSGAKLAGQAFTPWACARCDAQFSHPNTAVPALCRDCADKAKLCVTCMGDREGRRRKVLP